MSWERAFTVAQANDLLPLLEEVLAAIREAMADVRLQRDKLQVLDVLWGRKVEEPGNPDHAEYLDRSREAHAAAERIDDMVRREIIGRGIRFPQGALAHGLFDFPTTYEDRWVLLCWRSGEPRVQAWHELDGGFAGRRPLTPAQAAAMGLPDAHSEA